MNRQQKRAEARAKAKPPQYLLDTKGNPVTEILPMTGGLFSDAGEQLPGGPDLQELISACPFRSLICQVWPAPISLVWRAPDGEPTPPAFIAQAIVEEVTAGRALLLLATDRVTRDQAKVGFATLLGEPAGVA